MRNVMIDLEKLSGYCTPHHQLKDIAKAVGRIPPTISAQLRGKSDISFDILNKYAAFLGKNADEFLVTVEGRERRLLRPVMQGKLK